MAVNCRFATGVHVLVLLAADPDTLQTSTDIAEKLDTNPVVVRRVLASLQQAKLIESQKGPTGGSRLLRSPRAISLAEVYQAVETGSLFHAPRVHASVPVRVNAALGKIFSSATEALMKDFEKTTLSQVLKRVSKASRR
jgi:Rrf2 family protein